MDQLTASAHYSSSSDNILVQLSLLSFKEDDVVIVYSPALDLSGYGEDEKSAKESFQEALSEFLRDTSNKKTLWHELKRMGWKIKGSKKRPRFEQPFLDNMLRDNDYLSEVVREKEFHRFNEPVQMPAYAYAYGKEFKKHTSKKVS
jgi:hypothetical protein